MIYFSAALIHCLPPKKYCLGFCGTFQFNIIYRFVFILEPEDGNVIKNYIWVKGPKIKQLFILGEIKSFRYFKFSIYDGVSLPPPKKIVNLSA